MKKILINLIKKECQKLDINSLKELCTILEIYIPTEDEIKQFIVDWCEEVYEMPDSDLELKMDNHRCIEYKGTQYFIDRGNSMYSGEENLIHSFLYDNFQI